VDSGSTDGSRDFIASLTDPRIHPLFLDRNGGGALGFELGLREAAARLDPDWFVLMDDDAHPLPGAIAAFRTQDKTFDVLAAAVFDAADRIFDMNRPWINPFWSVRTFCSTLLGGGRDAFHMGRADYAADHMQTIHGASFVGLFLSREAVRRGGFPDGRMFIYGDDVHYTLGLTQRGCVSVFAPHIRFRHNFTTIAADGVFRPLWKTYYHHRNLWRVYRRAAGAVLFVPLMMLMVPKWLLKGANVPAPERATFRKLVRLALRDALQGNLSRPHEEIVARSIAEDAPPPFHP